MRVVVSGETTRIAQQLRSQVNTLGQECGATDSVSLDNLRLRLSSGGPVDLVLIKAGEDEVAALSAIQHANSARIPVFVVGAVEEDFKEQTRQAGARAWIDEQNFKDQMLAALDELYRGGGVRAKRGRLFVVTAAGAGNGVTTAATAIAFALAREHPNEVILGELNADAPEMALNLALEYRYDLTGLVTDWERSDPHVVRQVAVKHESGGLHVLAYPSETLTPAPLNDRSMRHLSVLLRESFAHVVLDLGHSATPASLEAMRLAESIVVMTRPEIPALRLTRAYLVHLRDKGIPLENVKLVANRSGYRKQVKEREIESLLGRTPVAWISDDPGTVIGALCEGLPLIEYTSGGLTKAFGKLAKLLDAPAAK